MGIIGKPHNDECIIYIFTGNFQNSTPSIFNKSLYHFWCKESRNIFSPVMVDTTHKNFHILDQINGKIHSSCIIDQQTINISDLCYQYSKDGTDF